MGHHNNCKDWDYGTHPDRQKISQRCDKLVKVLRRRPGFFHNVGVSTKPGHKYMFSGFAPAACKALVGNYRGSLHPCLKNYRVTVHEDTRVGAEPFRVAALMGAFETRLKAASQTFETTFAAQKGAAAGPVALVQFVTLLSLFLEQFLTIHPYANGNGHCARLLVWVLLTRYGFTPVSWPLDASPPSPAYSDAISAFRDGNQSPLIAFMLNCIKGP